MFKLSVVKSLRICNMQSTSEIHCHNYLNGSWTRRFINNEPEWRLDLNIFCSSLHLLNVSVKFMFGNFRIFLGYFLYELLLDWTLYCRSISTVIWKERLWLRESSCDYKAFPLEFNQIGHQQEIKEKND